MQLALGAVYGWSVFLNPLQDMFSASRLEVSLVFTITLVMLGLTAGLGGYLQSRFGPRTIAMTAGVLYGGGVALSSLAPSLPMLYLTYGVIGGIGLGFGYIVPLTVLTGWFPDKRGQITGLAVTGFGLGALITSPLATHLIAAIGVSNTLLFFGLIYFRLWSWRRNFWSRHLTGLFLRLVAIPSIGRRIRRTQPCRKRFDLRNGICCGRCLHSTSRPAPR